MRLLWTLSLLLGLNALSAQILNPVAWEAEVQKISEQRYELIIQAQMDEGWSIYSQHTDDNGPIPTSFVFDAGDHYERLGEVVEEGVKKEGPDPLFDN
ncbi:MAG: hypothetical protein R3350_01555, partial [Saprospiraceae bacterium]|nr:hypothetical protein [Saprospiraceae bacterium]